MVDLLFGAEVFRFLICQFAKFARSSQSIRYLNGIAFSPLSQRRFPNNFHLHWNVEAIDVTKVNFSELSLFYDEFDFELESPSYRFVQVEATIEGLKADIERPFLAKFPHCGEFLQLYRSFQRNFQNCRGMFLCWRDGIWSVNPKFSPTFRRSSQNLWEQQFSLLWRGEIVMVSKQQDFTADVTVSQTLWLGFLTRKETFPRVSIGGVGITNTEIPPGQFQLLHGGCESEKFCFYAEESEQTTPRGDLRWKPKGSSRPSFVIPNVVHHFSGGVSVSDNCNANMGSDTSLGISYTNEARLEEDIIFAGSHHFLVREIWSFRHHKLTNSSQKLLFSKFHKRNSPTFFRPQQWFLPFAVLIKVGWIIQFGNCGGYLGIFPQYEIESCQSELSQVQIQTQTQRYDLESFIEHDG